MKILFTSIFTVLTISCFSQGGQQQVSKRALVVNTYAIKQGKIINYDKSFVSDDQLFFESLGAPSQEVCLDDKLIKKVLEDYMNGSSYNQHKMLEDAFAKNATLYLTGREGFKRYTPKEYVGFFKNGVKGKFNGRHGKILGIEVVKDIATAKVEISMPSKSMVYIDLFLLKKLENGWKIISKTATRVDNEKK
ncbi:nuclear transport factor 2 family protein [uncultured Tenacibaculum sp.]|uniref:nuclear transport factor 2 family protein n=1 Tax=uncultured Tenacibaculum sp. TaxID=174713 RepID=UPI00260D181C|nr:nuclear transport factor 2 family protein [uncultured Tenacibaculum sp.]